jgi:N-acetylmuramoyl-L-alanine amidase
MQRALALRSGGVDRGLKRARFEVLKLAPCPAALVECGFVSNAIEQDLLTRKEHRETLADAIAQGILAYAGKTPP